MLDELLREIEAGSRLPTDPWFRVIDPGSPGTHLVWGFTGVNIVVTDLDPEWVGGLLPTRPDLSAPLLPAFLGALEGKLDRRVNNVDMLLIADPLDGDPGIPMTRIDDLDHPRVRRAQRYRSDIVVYQAAGGVVIVGRGVGGRWEVAVEVPEHRRDVGLGRALARAARHLIPEGRAVWAQIAPANAASVRAFLAAGYVPVGAEALLVERVR